MALNFESSKALISTSHCAIGMQLQSCNVLLVILKGDYHNWGHIHKVDQSDAIMMEITNMDQSQPFTIYRRDLLNSLKKARKQKT